MYSIRHFKPPKGTGYCRFRLTWTRARHSVVTVCRKLKTYGVFVAASAIKRLMELGENLSIGSLV